MSQVQAPRGMDTATRALVVTYLALMALAWPVAAGGLHPGDLVFPVVAVLVVLRCAARWEWRPLDYCVAAYVLSLVPSLWVTDDVRATGFELVKRGYTAGLYVIFAMYFRADGAVLAVRTLVRAAAVTCAVSLAAVALYLLWNVQVEAFVAANVLPGLGRAFRLRGGTESAAMFGNYLTFAVPFVVAAIVLQLIGRVEAIAAGLLVAVAMALSLSHALPGFVAALVMILWPLLGGHRLRVLRAASLAAVVAVALAMNIIAAVAIHRVDVQRDRDSTVPPPAYHYVFQDPRGSERLSVRVSYDFMSYWLLKRAALAAFIEHPVAGVGVGRFPAVAERAYQEGRIHEPFRAADPHSTYLGALAETGVVGAIGVLAMLGGALMCARRTADRSGQYVWLAATAAVVGLAVNGVNVDILNFRFLWVGLALLRS